MDGEIDLKSCVNVSEFDVEKNYGFQVQVRLYSVPVAIVIQISGLFPIQPNRKIVSGCSTLLLKVPY